MYINKSFSIDIMKTNNVSDVENIIIKKPEKKKPEQKKPEKKKPEKPLLTYETYLSNNIVFANYKMNELKVVINQYKLRKSGTKDILIDRIRTHFERITSSIKIQKHLRRWLVKYSIVSRGPALHNRSLCVNNMDFCTMEPLDEIDVESFFSVYDTNKIVYGFNISSLITMFEKSKKYENPYTREEFSTDVIRKIKNIYNINFILFDEFKKNNTPLLKISASKQKLNLPQTNFIDTEVGITNDREQQYTELIHMRNLPQEQRIRAIFIEFDRLGNYTNSNWLSNLDSHRCLLLYRNLFAIWNHRSGLSRTVQQHICQFFNPFTDVIDVIMNDVFDIDKMKDVCITIIENMIFSGINDDYKTIGSFHVLTAFTLVSVDARNALPWLYESISAN